MRRIALGLIIAGIAFFHAGAARAQDSLQILRNELNEAKQAHQEVTAASLANFFDKVDPAMGSAQDAVVLYQHAGGSMPPPSPVIKQNENETATEKERRLALDQANLNQMGSALELQCGMLHYAALFVVKPDQAGLQDQWLAWLKAAAQSYPQVAMPGGFQTSASSKMRKQNTNLGDPIAEAPLPSYDSSDLLGTGMKDTAISKFLAFNAWGDKEQGRWSVRDVPRLYRSDVLEPLRATPSEVTLAAWDVYIAMANADEKDNDQWNKVVFPPLQFDRACDDYTVGPGTEKLEVLVNLIKARPTDPHVDEWIARAGQLMDDYRAKHGGALVVSTPAATTNAPSGNPNVTVTTEQQGDATIITTHSNSAPVSPLPPGR